MAVLADGRFWVGIALGILAFWLWMRYRSQQAT